MRTLPRNAQLYLMAVYAAGTLCLLAAGLCALPRAHGALWELTLLIVLAALAGGKKIRLMRHTGAEDVGSMSLGFAITFAAMLRFGPIAAVVVGTVGSLSAGLFPKRQPAHQLLFNLMLTAVESWLAGMAFLGLNGWQLSLEAVRTFPAVIAASLIYFAVNTGGTAVVIALCSARSAVQLWRESFFWTLPSFFAGACITTLIMLWGGDRAGWLLLYGSPVAVLTYHSYATYAARAEDKQAHIEELKIGQAHLADLYLATIKSLALAIDAKDQYTHQHILRVQRYAVATATHMGLAGPELEGLITGALLHDIGKLGVPEYVLLKPGRLTDDEFAKIKKHPEIGANILEPVEFPYPVLPVVKYHHEKWDGTGYPEGLQGEAIPLTARILACADVYDALTSNRSYRNAWPHARAVEVIRKDAGTHFDPVVAEAFLAVIDGVVAEMQSEQQAQPPAAPEAGENPSSKAAQAARDISRTSSELWALYEVAQTLSSSLALQETLEILARKLEAILPGTACLFLLRDETQDLLRDETQDLLRDETQDLLRDETQDLLRVRAAVGVNREFFAGGHTLSVSSRSQTVARTRASALGEYDSDDLLLTSSPSVLWVPLGTALIVPIVHQGEVLGTINLYHPLADAFDPHDQQLLETIADRAAMAIYNGLLFDRTRSHALTDSLTGLYNVRYLTQYVEEKCRASTEKAECACADTFALLCLDLDSFKPINDNFGHQKGDQVLRDLSALFQATVGAGDVVARYGGDEFLIVLQETDAEGAAAMAQRLHEAVENYDPGLLHYRLGALHLGVSIGIGCFPQDGTDCATLLSAADTQMYFDKTERKLGKLVERAAAPGAEPPAAESLPGTDNEISRAA